MSEWAHPNDPDFEGTVFDRRLLDRYAACNPRIEGKRVLDVPCGTGLGSSLLRGYEFLAAVDIHIRSLQFGTGRHPGVAFAAGAMQALPFAPSSFDVVLCLNGERIFDSEARASLEEMARVLAPGGEFIAIVSLRKGQHSANRFDPYEFGNEEIRGLLERWFEPVETDIHGDGGERELWFVGMRRKTVHGSSDATMTQRRMLAPEEARNCLQDQAERWRALADERGRLVEELQREVASLEKARERLQNECDQWRQTAEDRNAALTALQRYARSLAAEEAATSQAGSTPRMPPPGPLARSLRTALMIASPRPATKWKNLALWAKVMLHSESRRLWRLSFDDRFYRAAHSDIASVNAALHYVLYGHLEGRIPSPDFNGPSYSAMHEDVRAEGINPLLHYILFGQKEQRLATPPKVSGHGSAPASVSGTVKLRRFTASRQPSDPLVSVVIPCFNYGQYLGEALASVAAQTFTNWEIVVVEGGSTNPSSVEAVRTIEARGCPNTTFLYREGRHLAGDNRNFGIEHARGEYICCLDADDLIKPTYLEAAVFLAETYRYDLVYPSVQCFGESTSHWLLCDATFEQLLDHNQVSTVAVFRRSAWERVGRYRDWGLGEEYVAEDWHLWLRMVGDGCLPKAIAEPLMLYRVKHNSLWHSTQDNTNVQRAKILADCKSLAGHRPSTASATVAGDWQRLLPEEDAVNGTVLLALPFLAIGGAERIFEAVTSALLAQGRRVIIVTSLVPGGAVKDNRAHFEKLTPHVYGLPHLFENQEHRWPDFVSYLLSRYRVETIFIAGSAFFYSLLPAIRRAFPEIAVVDQLFNDQVHFPANRAYAQYIDRTIVPSDAFAAKIVAEHDEVPERVVAIPHGVSVPPAPTPAEIADAREIAGLPGEFRDCLLVGFFGRMSPEKAPLDFVEIARALAPDTRIAFVMTGEGPERPAVLRRIRDYGIRSRIHTPGFVEDVIDLLTAVDIVILPSHLDGMPLLVLEALGLEKAVVASRVGSVPYMVRDRETGLLCEPGEIREFISGVRELQGSPRLRRRLGAAGRKLVLERYSSETMVSRYLSVFGEAARARVEDPGGASDEVVSAGGAMPPGSRIVIRPETAATQHAFDRFDRTASSAGDR